MNKKQLRKEVFSKEALFQYHDIKEKHQYLMEQEINDATDRIIAKHSRIIDLAWRQFLAAKVKK